MPPVHELTAEDLPHLDRLLAEVDVLVSQPVRAATAACRWAPPRSSPAPSADRVSVVVPIVRWAALHPFQVDRPHPGRRPPGASRTPTCGPWRWPPAGPRCPRPPPPPPSAPCTRCRCGSCGRGEQRHGTVLAVVDLLDGRRCGRGPHRQPPGQRRPDRPGPAGARGGRGARRARRPRPHAAGPRARPGPARGPRRPGAGGRPGAAHDDWVVDGARIPDAAVREAQLRWYADHPGSPRRGWTGTPRPPRRWPADRHRSWSSARPGTGSPARRSRRRRRCARSRRVRSTCCAGPASPTSPSCARPCAPRRPARCSCTSPTGSSAATPEEAADAVVAARAASGPSS